MTNGIYTPEDAEFLNRTMLSKSPFRAVETGGCPHAAIREDVIEEPISNLQALEDLTGLIAPPSKLLVPPVVHGTWYMYFYKVPVLVLL